MSSQNSWTCVMFKAMIIRQEWNYNGVVMQIINKFREVDAKSKGIDNPNTSAGELNEGSFLHVLHWCFFSSSWLFSSWSKELQISVFSWWVSIWAFLFRFSRFFLIFVSFWRNPWGRREIFHFLSEGYYGAVAGFLGLSLSICAFHLQVPRQLCRILVK